MSRARITYTICYVLMLLALVAFPFILKATRDVTPQEQWNGFHPWFGPAPLQLQAEEWNHEASDRQGVIFTFCSTEEWRAKLIHTFGLADKDRETAPLPEHREKQLHPFLPKLTAWPKLMITHDASSGFDVRDMTLAQLSDGRTLLAFRYKWDNEFGKRDLVLPSYEKQPEPPTQLWLTGLYIVLSSLFLLLVPLGFLLLFPGFDLTRKRHMAYWFMTAAFFPVILLISACTCTGVLSAIPAAIFWCIILVPWQLAGAGMLLPIVMMIAFRKDRP